MFIGMGFVPAVLLVPVCCTGRAACGGAAVGSCLTRPGVEQVTGPNGAFSAGGVPA